MAGLLGKKIAAKSKPMLLGTRGTRPIGFGRWSPSREHKHSSPARQVTLACAARAMSALQPQDRGTYWLVLSPACWPVAPSISPQRAGAFTCTLLRAPTWQEVSALSDFLRVRYRVKSPT